MNSNSPNTALTKVVIWGAGGHALVVADILRLQGGYEIVGHLDSVNPQRRGEVVLDAPILGGTEQLQQLREAGVAHLVFGFGDCKARLATAPRVQALGFRFIIALHPQAVVAPNAVIGAGTVIAAGAVINPNAVIGEHAIINTAAIIDHGCVIADGAHISPGVKLGGGARVGRATWVGIGATVINDVRIGDESMIGAGAVVVADIPDGVVAFGVPAKIQRAVSGHA